MCFFEQLQNYLSNKTQLTMITGNLDTKRWLKSNECMAIFTVKKVITYIVILISFSGSGCSLKVTNRIGHTLGDSTSQHVNRYAWGLINSGVNKPRCWHGINKVRTDAGFADSLLTIITLGIYCPVTVTWWCSNKNIDPH